MSDRMAGGAFALAADPSLLAAEAGHQGGYNIEAVPPEGFAEFILHLSSHGFFGANVTIPHKERALALSTPDDRARAVGAANTLWYDGGQLLLDQHRRRGICEQSRRQRAGLGRGQRRAGARRRRFVACRGVWIA